MIKWFIPAVLFAILISWGVVSIIEHPSYMKYVGCIKEGYKGLKGSSTWFRVRYIIIYFRSVLLIVTLTLYLNGSWYYIIINLSVLILSKNCTVLVLLLFFNKLLSSENLSNVYWDRNRSYNLHTNCKSYSYTGVVLLAKIWRTPYPRWGAYQGGIWTFWIEPGLVLVDIEIN